MKWFLHSFWFHMLVASMIVLAGWWIGLLNYTLAFNLLFWPLWELWQKRAHIRDFFSVHVLLEWSMPILVSIIMYGVLK